MANPENLVKHKMKKGETRNPNGRPPKVKTILKRQGLSQSQVNDIATEMLAMTKEELKEIVSNPKSKSFEILIASAISKGISKGDLSQVFGHVLTRAFGQPKQDIDVKAEIKTVDPFQKIRENAGLQSVGDSKKSKEKQAVKKKPKKPKK